MEDNGLSEDNPRPDRFLRRCFVMGTLSAYLSAVFLSFPFVEWEIGEARTVRAAIAALPLLLINPFGAIWVIPPLIACIATSSAWIIPIARIERVSREARLLAVILTSAVASLCLFYVLCLTFPSRNARRDYSCSNNLKQLGLVMRMYSNENESYPELCPRSGTLAVRGGGSGILVYPDYLSDLRVFQCPVRKWPWNKFKQAPPDSAAYDGSYFYLGYAIPDQEALAKFSEAYRACIAQGKTFDNDLEVHHTGGSVSQILRLRSSLFEVDSGPAMATLNSNSIPIMVERHPNAHQRDGGNVLYADGHVEWIAWGAKWPMTEEAMAVLMDLDALGAHAMDGEK